jgi:hypothetical protein
MLLRIRNSCFEFCRVVLIELSIIFPFFWYNQLTYQNYKSVSRDHYEFHWGETFYQTNPFG